jgi:hypothetical protein
MSIVTLKKKFQAQYNNSSVGHPQFSLNGTTRNAGYIGQDMLGRSLVRSLSKNGALKGHGGCGGHYPTPQIKTSPEMSGLNNPAIVKSSSLNTNGLLMSRYRWIRRPDPYSTTKGDSNRNNNSQSIYINFLARKTVRDMSGCNIIKDHIEPLSCDCSKKNYNSNINSAKNPHIVKSDKYTGAVSSSEHLRYLNNNCVEDDQFKIIKIGLGLPFACKDSKVV